MSRFLPTTILFALPLLEPLIVVNCERIYDQSFYILHAGLGREELFAKHNKTAGESALQLCQYSIPSLFFILCQLLPGIERGFKCCRTLLGQK